MQAGSGQQQNAIPGSTGTPYNAALLFQAQAGQMSSQILAPRLALMPGGARTGAAPMGPGTAAAAGAQYRPGGVHLPGMGMLLKAPPRKSGPNQKGRKHCNCKNSRCLKLYCECFASGRYCDNCNCLSCFNNKESESVRQSAVEAILERNPNAFRPKIQTAEGDTHPQSIRNAPDGSVRHTKGCNCKKSSCLKKYCECFQGGIFCTEICKCVDCKNYDGSEARAQVLSCHEPFNMQSLHQAAQAHAALKRPRMQVPQMTTTVGPAGLLQAQNALQHLAAAAAAGGPNAPTMPLQQLQAMQAAAAAAAAQQQQQQQLQQQQQQPAPLPQPPARPPLLDVVQELVKPAVVEELCQLLILVAGEAADKQQQQQAAIGELSNGVEQQQEAASPAAVGEYPAKAAAVVVKVEQDADGDSVMQEAATEQQQQRSSPSADAGDYSASYAAQEAVVLQEFNSILQRIISQAEKKSNAAAATAAAAAAAAAAVASIGTVATGQESTAMGSGTEGSEQQQLLQQPKAGAQQMPIRPPVLSMPQQQAMVQQQAMMLQAASNNYALAQLQSRQAYLAGAGSGAQQMAAFGGAGALGMQQMQQMQQVLPGLRPMGMQQMVQVMAQDGSVHQIPAQSLMSLLPGASQQQQQQQQQAALSAAASAAPVSAAPAASAVGSSAAAAPAGVGVSLLSLLNGAINTSSSAAAGAGGGS